MEDKKQYTVTVAKLVRHYVDITVYAGSEDEARDQIDLDRVDLALFDNDGDETGSLQVYHVEEQR